MLYDDSLEQFFETILGFFDLKLVKNLERDSPSNRQITSQMFKGAMNGFMCCTLSSNSVTESVKSRRDTMSMIPCPSLSYYIYGSLFSHATTSIET